MGWCSGTDLFDAVVTVIMDKYVLNLSSGSVVDMVSEIIVRFEEHDWECQTDSIWINDPLIQEAFDRVHPTWVWPWSK